MASDNATIYSCALGPDSPFRARKPAVGTAEAVALKVIDRSNSSHQYCRVPAVLSEIRVLERPRDAPHVCQLLDFGVSADAYYLVRRRLPL